MATVAIDAVIEGVTTRISTHSIPLPPTATASKEVTSVSEKSSLNVSSIEQQYQPQKSPQPPIQKRLGCRRVEDDMITSSDEEDGDEEEEVVRRKLFFTSPRLVQPDERLFPVYHSPYKNSNQRWQLVSEQAGEHRQDGTVLMIGRKISPMALRIGMTQQAAKRVRSLNLWLDHDKDILPEWLDVIASIFVNLEHLTLTEDVFPGEDETAVSARMRRLYVLYRLPYLKSIDDMIVTEQERRMARPNETDPNGSRVGVRKAWSSLLDDDEEQEEEQQQHTKVQDNPDESDVLVDQMQQIGQQPNVAHEMPVEIIHDQFGHGVINDGVYGDEIDSLGQIPRIPATMSNVSTQTAKEVGVEINQELAAKFAELNRISTATTSTTMSDEPGLDSESASDDELAGEAMLSELAASSEEFGGPESQYSQSLSQSISEEENDENIVIRHVPVGSKTTSPLNQGDVFEVNLTGKIKERNTGTSDYSIEVPTEEVVEDEKVNEMDQKFKAMRSHVLDADDNSIELVSVASTEMEWTAACGVLAFRSDRTCAPRLRIPFSRTRKVIAADAAVAAIRQAKSNVRNKQREKESEVGKKNCTPVARNDTVSTPQVGCCTFRSSQGKFFPDRRTVKANLEKDKSAAMSANKQTPPSKSLSSPFPMQFRERQKTPPRTNLVVQTSYSTDSAKSRSSVDDTKETISSPLQSINSASSSSPRTRDEKKIRAGKGDLPPPCPAPSRRKVPVPHVRARKTKHRHRSLKSSKVSARSTSVMDLEDDDDEEDDQDEISHKLECINNGDDEESLAYSEAS
ncbi:hypothetical protein IV203_013505 [Nitzschia inconspicua]|uniref:Uncharacterized protein n=1 Tax=Nitzschia inconspicua TaxID=303405 RepID=A0A9K3Q8T8_9STRA|nr:hypothetical protein IV203_013505 [Nitzschia inconspicua]